MFMALGLLALIVGGSWLLGGDDAESAVDVSQVSISAEAPTVDRAEKEAPAALEQPRFELDPSRFELVGDHYIQRLDDGSVAHLTLEPSLQKRSAKMFDRRKVPHGGIAAIEPATGRVLALVSRSHSSRPSKNFALRAEAPSASVFKMVTSAALLEKAKIDPAKKICYSGGLRYLTAEQIKGNPGKDKENCANLGDAIGGSLNVVMARLAYYHLSKENLEEMALRFGFNREIPFEVPIDISRATFVDDDIERARTAAGFWNVHLSPMHGAMISAAISNDGVMMRPTLVDRVEKNGQVIYRHKPTLWLASMSRENARVLASLGQKTTTVGTASKLFSRRKGGWPKDMPVTGKTGTLANKKPYLLFTWFVGAAPLHRADISVGALVANGPKWWVKGMHAASDMFLSYRRLRRERAKKKP